MCRWGRNEIPGGSLQATSCRGAGRLKAAVILSMVEILPHCRVHQPDAGRWRSARFLPWCLVPVRHVGPGKYSLRQTSRTAVECLVE